MKTLMLFAAALMVVGGAFAQCSDPVVSNCSLVYDFKASLKTTKGKYGISYSDCHGNFTPIRRILRRVR